MDFPSAAHSNGGARESPIEFSRGFANRWDESIEVRESQMRWPKASNSGARLLLLAATSIAACVGQILRADERPPSSLANSASPRTVLEPRWRHLRQLETREWDSFAETCEDRRAVVRFEAQRNAAPGTLWWRQADVKQAWKVTLNGQAIGELTRDEADLIASCEVPAGALRDGPNELVVECATLAPGTADDIRWGELAFDPRPPDRAWCGARLNIRVVEESSNRPLPARITIVDPRGARAVLATRSSKSLAVRSGVAYTADGLAELELPPGRYSVFAGRGFEYSVAHVDVELAEGATRDVTLAIRREVDTTGYVACDTHLHTLTHSGHGDATLAERMVTLAGEGIELPVATDHNVQIEHELAAREAGVRSYFTPVAGNEVTTPAGHFNIFPVAPGGIVPDHRSADWRVTLNGVFRGERVRVAVLNHARDLHAGVRPFGPDRWLDVVAEPLDGRPLRFRALEIINSGATQTDPLQLTRDWFTLLNRGLAVTPVGSSDSHDVTRYIPGQGRTYIRCDDREVGQIDVEHAIDSFLAGRVLVSYGLMAELTVAGKYRPGDLADVGDAKEIPVELCVRGPHWTEVSRVQLYANGQLVREIEIPATHPGPVASGDSTGQREPGVRWRGQWSIPRPAFDQHWVAVAIGPGVGEPYWPTAKPYQPQSIDSRTWVLGVSGAVWIDGDADGRRQAARDYAERAWLDSDGQIDRLAVLLDRYDAPTAAHTLHRWRLTGRALDEPALMDVERRSGPSVRSGWRAYREAWVASERARVAR